MFPAYALTLILFLFLFEDQLNEQLLQLLVTIIDAELLKAATNRNRIQNSLFYSYETNLILGTI